MEKPRLVVVRVKGDVGLSADLRRTLKLLRLYRKNYCVVLPSNPQIIGMIQKIKDLVTFGELDKDTFVRLLKARAKIAGDKPATEDYFKSKANLDFEKFAEEFFTYRRELRDVPGVKQFFRLQPPVGGFEIGGIKSSYAQGGTLGYRGKEINRLLMRMM
jgi:large subunit ribosomal protein L30